MRHSPLTLATAALVAYAYACSSSPPPSEVPSQSSLSKSITPPTPTKDAAEPRWLATLDAKWTQEENSRRGTVTITPSPTIDAQPLSALGPWLVGEAERGIWVSNFDGSAKKWLLAPDTDSYTIPAFALSPNGAAAAVAHAPSAESTLSSDYSLSIFRLPSTSPTFTTTLFAQEHLDFIAKHFPTPSSDSPIEASDFYRRDQVVMAMVSRPNGLAWSPDSGSLAFVAALDGPTSDVYLLEPQNGVITRLSSGTMQASSLLWSPDGKYIAHQAVSDFNPGRGGDTDNVESLWAAHIDGSPPTLLIDGPATSLAWLSRHVLLAYLDKVPCGYYSLVAIDVETGRYMPIWRGSIDIEWTAPTDFTIKVPPQAYDNDPLEPDFARWCPAPANAPSIVDLAAVTSLPQGAFTSSQDTTILITSREGTLSFIEAQPTPTYTPSSTPSSVPTGTPRPPP